MIRELLVPISEEQMRRQNASTGARSPHGETPLITLIGLVQAEALVKIEQLGSVTLSALAKELRSPMHVVVMAVGALIYQGLVRGAQNDLTVVLRAMR